MLVRTVRAGALLLRTLRLALSAGAPARELPGRGARVLVLGYAAVGDLVYLLPALRALRRLCPDARVVFVANRYPTTTELMPAAGLVDEVRQVELDDASLAEARGRLAGEVYDAVIATLSTPLGVLGPALAGIPLRVGHCRPLTAPRDGWSAARYALWRLKRGLVSGEFDRRLLFNRPVWVGEDDEHIVSRNLRLVRALGLETGPEDAAPPALPLSQAHRRRAAELLGGGAWAAVHLGSPASQYGKLWEPERWGAVAKGLSAARGVRVVLLGAADEAEAARRFAAASGGGHLDLVGKTTLLESFAVLERCALVMANDTGLAKASMALGVPTVTVWGPSDRPGWGVFWDPARHLEVRRSLPCMPCVRIGLRQEGAGVINFATCGHRACLAELSAGEVLAAVLARYGRDLPPR